MEKFLNWEVIRMTVYLVGFFFGLAFIICGVIASKREFSDNVKMPWEKEERKAAKIAAKKRKKAAAQARREWAQAR